MPSACPNHCASGSDAALFRRKLLTGDLRSGIQSETICFETDGGAGTPYNSIMENTGSTPPRLFRSSISVVGTLKFDIYRRPSEMGNAVDERLRRHRQCDRHHSACIVTCRLHSQHIVI